jgi:hydroxymethylbilane synthase
VRAERALMRRLEGGCQVPIGAHGQLAHGELRLRAFVGSLDGRLCVRDAASGAAEDPERLGGELASRLLERGAARILETVRAVDAGPPPQVT